jgi:hypothetical protein
MPISTALAVLAALLTAAPAAPKQSWGSAVKPEANARFWPRAALVEVDGKPAGRGWVLLQLPDGAGSLRVRVSADGFETEEAIVEVERIRNKQFFLALRPAGFAQKLDPLEPAGMARAAEALWKAGRANEAVEYAEQSLANGNTPLANRVLGDVARSRGDRDAATRYYTMYVSLRGDSPEAAEMKKYLMQDRPGDITVPSR